MAITFEQIQKANDTIKSTDIGKGKEYAEVNQRIKAFRMLYPTGVIMTDMISNENGVVIFKATVMTDECKILGTGTAYEKEGSSFINKTSYIENCETSAVGRALAMCGIGIDVSVASKEEVENAKLNQGEPKNPIKGKAKTPQDEAVELAKAKARVIGYINRSVERGSMTQEDIGTVCRFFKVESLNDLTLEHCNKYIKSVEKRGGNIDE